MPTTIDIQHELLTYTGFFDQPTLSLWGNGGTIVRGFYEAFASYNMTLRNFQIHGTTPTPADPIVTVTVGSAIVKFSFESIEVTFTSLSEQELRNIPTFLGASISWLKKAVPEFKFRSHSIAYFQHSLLKGATVEKILAAVGPKKLDLPGVDLGSGLIINRSVPEKYWTTQLVIDRSAAFPGGLFLSVNIKVGTGAVEYGKLFEEGMSFYADILRVLGLESPFLAGIKTS
jgi:hypothetical protein